MAAAPGGWNELKSWFYKNGCYVKNTGNAGARDQREITHLLLDGGRVHVAKEQAEEFLKQYARSLQRAERNYVVETRTQIFRFMMDLDMMEEEQVPFDRVLEIVRCIQKTLVDFYGACDDLQAIVNTTETKIVTKQATDERPEVRLVKTGVHLIWPGLPVDVERAHALRRSVIFDLASQFGERSELNPWDDVVDRVVYECNGLRMIGSRKCSVCKGCHNAKTRRAACAVCHGAGKYDEGRVYAPQAVMRHDGTLDPDELLRLTDAGQRLYLIRRTTIRLQGVEKIPGVPPFRVPERLKERLNPLDARVSGRRRRLQRESKELPGDGASAPLDTDSEAYRQLAAYIRRSFPTGPEVTQIVRPPSKHYLIAQSSSRFCANKGSEHDRNRVYFFISPSGVVQRCHCTCPVMRRFTTCSNFKSACRPLPPLLFRELFPDMKQKASAPMHVPPGCKRQKISPGNLCGGAGDDHSFLAQQVDALRERVRSQQHREAMAMM